MSANLNYQQAADYLGVKVDTLQRWSASRRIERFKYDNGQVMFTRQMLDDYLERRRQPVVDSHPTRKRPSRKRNV
jgi:excisionase family DNA binding protein